MPNGTAADSTGLAAPDHPIENQPCSPVDACLTPVETAAKLGISTRTLENWRRMRWSQKIGQLVKVYSTG